MSDGGVWTKIWPDSVPDSVGTPEAKITAITGSGITHTYDDFVAFEFLTDGTMTVTESGYADILVISGGGGGNAGAWDGSVGRVIFGMHYLDSGSLSVTVGSGGPANTAGAFGESVLGILKTGFAGAFDTYDPAGFTSSITGSSVTYCLGGKDSPRANRGDSGRSTGVAGGSGVVIVKVKASNAANVDKSGWTEVTEAMQAAAAKKREVESKAQAKKSALQAKNEELSGATQTDIEETE